MIGLLAALLIQPVDPPPLPWLPPHQSTPCVYLPQQDVWLCPPGFTAP
jgi:hypothetical protein